MKYAGIITVLVLLSLAIDTGSSTSWPWRSFSFKVSHLGLTLMEIGLPPMQAAKVIVQYRIAPNFQGQSVREWLHAHGNNLIWCCTLTRDSTLAEGVELEQKQLVLQGVKFACSWT